MAKIIKRKDNHLVLRCLDNSDTIDLTSTGCSWTYGGRPHYSQDLNSNDHEIVEGVDAPTSFFAGYFYYNGSWTLDTDKLNRYNEMASPLQDVDPISAEL